MGRMRARLRALVLGGFAASGVLASHSLGYRIAVPDHHHRADVLHSTGHQFWGYFVALAVGLLVAGLAAFVTRRLASGSAEGGRAAMFRYALLRLLPLGLVTFVGLEAIERSLFAEHQTQALFEQAPVLIGIALQAVIALLGALVLVLVSAVVDALRKTGPRFARVSSLANHFLGKVRSFSDRVALGGCGMRAPPALRA